MPNLKLTYATKITLEFDNEEDLRMALRNVPGLNVTPAGFGSAQSHVKSIISTQCGGTLVDGEKVMIENALNACDNNKTAAAAMLGITRATIHSKIKHYDL